MADAPVVDTDVLIDYLRGRGPGADLLARLGRGGYRVTAVSAFELALGSAHLADPRPVQALLDTRNVRHFARVPGLRVVRPQDWS